MVYAVEYWSIGAAPPPPTGDVRLFFKLVMATSMLSWVAVYLVKFSFLMLWRSLFGISDGFRRAWWVVAGFTFLTFWPLFLSTMFGCGRPQDLGNLSMLFRLLPVRTHKPRFLAD